MKFKLFYNMKSNDFHHSLCDSYPKIKEIKTNTDYIYLGEIEANDLEDLFFKMNYNHPKTVLDKVNELHESDKDYKIYPTLHSSLSCGDIVVDENNNYFYCDRFGWKELE